jgi:hypothetical protein
MIGYRLSGNFMALALSSGGSHHLFEARRIAACELGELLITLSPFHPCHDQMIFKYMVMLDVTGINTRGLNGNPTSQFKVVRYGWV